MNKCNLELAKRLKELGVKQESEWYWVNFNDGKGFSLRYRDCLYEIKHNNWEHYSAFTVGELGEMLPEEIIIENNTFIMYQSKHKGKYAIWYCSGLVYEPTFEDELEANARAKMLVYLLENKLIKEV